MRYIEAIRLYYMKKRKMYNKKKEQKKKALNLFICVTFYYNAQVSSIAIPILYVY